MSLLQRAVDACNKIALNLLFTKSTQESEMTMNTQINKRAAIRTLVASAGNEFVRLSFVKKDGTIRHITHRANMMAKHIKQDAESKAKAAIRATNNPHLLTVLDIHASNKLPDDQKARAIRSINLDNVYAVKWGGNEIAFGKLQSYVAPL